LREEFPRLSSPIERRVEADLHRHIHKGNHILFPKAVAEESLKPQR
jgi:iron-sulfur cluster repair protein YtfE (RIC family)